MLKLCLNGLVIFFIVTNILLHRNSYGQGTLPTGLSYAIMIQREVSSSANPVFTDANRRGAALPDPQLEEFLSDNGFTEKEVIGFPGDIDGNEEAFLSYLKQFNLIILGAGGEPDPDLFDSSIRNKVDKVIDTVFKHVSGGGGLLFLRTPTYQNNNDIEEYNRWFKDKDIGIEIKDEQIVDDNNICTELGSDRPRLYWTDNILNHEVSIGVNGLLYPDSLSFYGEKGSSNFTSPVEITEGYSDDWEIIISGMPDAHSEERLSRGTESTWYAFAEKPLALLAVRDYKGVNVVGSEQGIRTGRIAVMPIASSCIWQDAYHPFWNKEHVSSEGIVALKGCGEEKPFDGAQLMLNIFNYLSERSRIYRWNLHMVTVASEFDKQEMVSNFKDKLEENKSTVLIVNVDTDTPKVWTIAMFDDEGTFVYKELVDDGNHELALELNKEKRNNVRIIKLSTSYLGLTRSDEDYGGFESAEYEPGVCDCESDMIANCESDVIANNVIEFESISTPEDFCYDHYFNGDEIEDEACEGDGSFCHYVGLIGAMSNFSSGTQNPQEFINKAKCVGYDFIAFTEDLNNISKDHFVILKDICNVENDNPDSFKAYAGLKYEDESCNTWVTFSNDLDYDKFATLLNEDNQIKNNENVARGQNWPPIILVHPNRDQEKAEAEKEWFQGNFNGLSLFTYDYKDDKVNLIYNGGDVYLRLLKDRFGITPTSVHLVDSPDKVNAAWSNGFQTYVRLRCKKDIDGNIVPNNDYLRAFKGSEPAGDLLETHYRPVYVSEGPIIEYFQSVPGGVTDLANSKTGENLKLFIKVSSENMLKNVIVKNSDDENFWRRYLPKEKCFEKAIDFSHDKQRELVLSVEDMDGKEAIGWSVSTRVSENQFIRVGDNMNSVRGGKWNTVSKGEIHNIRGFENFYFQRGGWGYDGTLIIGFNGGEEDTESAKRLASDEINNSAIEYRPEIVNRFCSIIDTKMEYHYIPALPDDVYDRTDRPELAVGNNFLKGRVKYSHFPGSYDDPLVVLVEGDFEAEPGEESDFPADALYYFNRQVKGGGKILALQIEGSEYSSEGYIEGKLLDKGYVAFTPEPLKEASGVISMDAEEIYRYKFDEKAEKEYQFSLTADPVTYNLNHIKKITYKYIIVTGATKDPSDDASFLTEIRDSMGLNSNEDPAYMIDPIQFGSQNERTFPLELDAQNYGFAGTITTHADLPIPLPVSISGLNPRWDAGILYKGTQTLSFIWQERDQLSRLTTCSKKKVVENDIFHFGVLEDNGTGYLQIDPLEGKKNVFIGNFLKSTNPDVHITLVQNYDDDGNDKFVVHNPTDNCIPCTISPVNGFNLYGDFSKDLTVPAGSDIEVDLNSVLYSYPGYSDDTVVDDLEDVGRFSSIAVDGNNRFHIAYYDATQGDLKYAVSAGLGPKCLLQWKVQTLDTKLVNDPADVGRYASLALDKSGQPYISYYDKSNGQLKFAEKSRGRWKITVVDKGVKGNAGLYTSLAVDKDGNMHVSYIENRKGPRNLTGGIDVGGGQLPRLDKPLSDAELLEPERRRPQTGSTIPKPWHRRSYGVVKYAKRVNGVWKREIIKNGGDYIGSGLFMRPGRPFKYTSLAVDSHSSPHVVYIDDMGGNLVYSYKKKSDNSWNHQPIDSNGRFAYPSIALHNQFQSKKVAYYDKDNKALKLAQWNMLGFPSVDWVTKIIDDSGDVGKFATLRIDSNGLGHIAYYNAQTSGLKYARRLRKYDPNVSSGWRIEDIVLNSEIDFGKHVSMTLNNDDKPAFSYYDATDGNLMFKRKE